MAAVAGVVSGEEKADCYAYIEIIYTEDKFIYYSSVENKDDVHVYLGEDAELSSFNSSTIPQYSFALYMSRSFNLSIHGRRNRGGGAHGARAPNNFAK